MEYRVERDTMGEVRVPADKLWGAQTQRSLEHFRIGTEKMPSGLIRALAHLKKAAAHVNREHGGLAADKAACIAQAADEVLAGQWDDQFPLAVWQTGSGTQTNMNVNEVLARRAGELLAAAGGSGRIHPNDDVNRSQSSNDTFPTAMHIAALLAVEDELLPALHRLEETLRGKMEAFADIVKIGRTHLQDATPLTLGQEISGWLAMVQSGAAMVRGAADTLRELAIGGTAVGTGLNAPVGFAEKVAERIAAITGLPFTSAPNKFEALAAHDAMVFSHGAINTVAASLFKIANDIRFLGSGPRSGLGELALPENEPGSSIMPGKVNPVMAEVVNQVAFQVMGNDLTICMACEAGQFELNVMGPVIAFNLLQSLKVLRNAVDVFRRYALEGMEANRELCRDYVDRSFGIVTALNPHLGYETAARLVKDAAASGAPIRELILERNLLSPEEMNVILDPVQMTTPGIAGEWLLTDRDQEE